MSDYFPFTEQQKKSNIFRLLDHKSRMFINMSLYIIKDLYASCLFDLPDMLSHNKQHKAIRDPSVYAPSQWDTTLQCNLISQWLGAYTKWFLCYTINMRAVNQEWQTWSHIKADENNRHAIFHNGPLTRYVKLQVAHAPGMPGTFSPAADFKGNR